MAALNCYVAKSLPVKYHTGHVWHIYKTRFVTLLSTKMLNSLKKIAEKNLSLCSIT